MGLGLKISLNNDMKIFFSIQMYKVFFLGGIGESVNR